MICSTKPNCPLGFISKNTCSPSGVTIMSIAPYTKSNADVSLAYICQIHLETVLGFDTLSHFRRKAVSAYTGNGHAQPVQPADGQAASNARPSATT